MANRVLLAILVIVMSAWTAGCSRYETWDAKFIGINTAPVKIIIKIDGVEQGAILPNDDANFMVKVTSGVNPNAMTGASSARTSTVSISIKNLANDRVTVNWCQAGERTKTTFIFYSTYSYDYINCLTNQ